MQDEDAEEYDKLLVWLSAPRSPHEVMERVKKIREKRGR
jgi:uncharacterized protein (DUF1778 family)